MSTLPSLLLSYWLKSMSSLAFFKAVVKIEDE